MIKHIKRWWYWRKQNCNGWFYKLLVLFKAVESPTFNHIWTPDEARDFYEGFMKGMEEAADGEKEQSSEYDYN